jgi:hypothetical protein
MKVLIIDDEWQERKEVYDKLSLLEGAQIELAYLKSFAELPSLVRSAQYGAFIVDVVLEKRWPGATLESVIAVLENRGPAALVSGVWDKTNFLELNKVFGRPNVQMAFQWRELEDPAGPAKVAFQLCRLYEQWHNVEELDLAPSDPIWILHLSDLQFGGFEADQLRRESGYLGQKVRQVCGAKGPTFIAITGDVAERGFPHEYVQAKEWLEKMVTHFDGWELPNTRSLLVEGNHDACIPLAAAGTLTYDRQKNNVELTREKQSYFDELAPYAFAPFRQFAWRVTNDHSWLIREDPYWVNKRYGSSGVVFFGVNTAAGISVSGLTERKVPAVVLEHLPGMIRGKADDERLKEAVVIGMFHHSPLPEEEDRAINNVRAFEMVLLNSNEPFIVLCGHVHERSCEIRDPIGYNVMKIHASTPTKGGPSDSLRGFNLLELKRKNSKVTGLHYQAWEWKNRALCEGPRAAFTRGEDGKWRRAQRKRR